MIRTNENLVQGSEESESLSQFSVSWLGFRGKLGILFGPVTWVGLLVGIFSIAGVWVGLLVGIFSMAGVTWVGVSIFIFASTFLGTSKVGSSQQFLQVLFPVLVVPEENITGWL